jgi:hypothetical protein
MWFMTAHCTFAVLTNDVSMNFQYDAADSRYIVAEKKENNKKAHQNRACLIMGVIGIAFLDYCIKTPQRYYMLCYDREFTTGEPVPQ